jgi:hypothetical protein
MSLDTRRKSLQETLSDTRNDLHEELGLMLQVEAQTTKAEIRVNQESLEAKIEATRCGFQTQTMKAEIRVNQERFEDKIEAT